MNLAVFNYSFKRILISKSTWILLAISILVLGGVWLGTNLSSTAILNSPQTASEVLNRGYVAWIMLSFFLFINLLTFIFLAVKSSQVIRDEIEDGTFLILMAKPISRSKIFISKFLAFQLIMILFTITTCLISSLFLFGVGHHGIYFKAYILKILLFIVFAIFLQFIFATLSIFLSVLVSSKILTVIMILIGTISGVLFFVSQTAGADRSSGVTSYANISQAVEMDQVFESKLPKDSLSSINELVANPDITITKWTNDLTDFYTKVLKQTGTTPSDFTFDYDSEQSNLELLKQDETDSKFSGLNQHEKDDLKNLYSIFETMRITHNQSYFEMLNFVPPKTGIPYITNYMYLSNFGKTLNAVIIQGIDNTTYNTLETNLMKQRLWKYLNPGYQWSYMMQTLTYNNHLKIFGDNYQAYNDNIALNFTKNDAGKYVLNTSQLNNMKVLINPIGIYSFYIILGVASFFGVWYIFNRKNLL